MGAKTATLPTISRTACSGDTAAAGAAAGAGNCAGVVTGTWEAGSGGSAIAMWQDFREQLGRRQQTSLISQAAATPILQGCGAKTATAGSGPPWPYASSAAACSSSQRSSTSAIACFT